MYPTIGVNNHSAGSVHPLQAWRERDVNNLLVQLPGRVWATDVNRCQFEAPIPGRPFPLYITLSPSYPSEPPMLTVGQPMAHAWVDSAQRVSSERLRRWTAAEASWSPLAAVVREALDVLTENPHNPQQHQQQADQLNHSNHQSTATFPEVDGLSNDQLREVLSSDGAFDALLEKVVQRSLSPSNANLQRLRQHNADLAGRTQSLMEQCRELSNQINIIRVSDYQPTKQQYDALHVRQAAVLDKLSPTVLLHQLEASAHTAEESSDELVQKLLRGEVQVQFAFFLYPSLLLLPKVEEFLEEYVPLRTLFHTREHKAMEARKHLVVPTA